MLSVGSPQAAPKTNPPLSICAGSAKAGPPAAAFDGEVDERSTSAIPGNFWASEADVTKNRDEWLQIALDTPTAAVAYRVRSRAHPCCAEADSPHAWVLDGSHDGATWIRLGVEEDQYAAYPRRGLAPPRPSWISSRTRLASPCRSHQVQLEHVGMALVPDLH